MRLTIIAILLLITACTSPADDYNGFVTRLGNDTLAVENFKLDGNQFHADVVVRSPRTILTRYEATLNEVGGVDSLSEYRFDPEAGFSGSGSFVRSIKTEGDSLNISFLRNGETQMIMIEKEDGIIPFIEYTHWPFELALLQAVGEDSVVVPMLAGSRARGFLIANLGGEARTVRHPSRGVMDVTVNASGELETLDAAQTTRKLIVQRTEGENVERAAKQFARAEANGRGFGALSGAIIEDFEVRGVSFTLDYGSPSKRGRDLFGGIVPYGERWRTGANRATHIKFDQEISIGGLTAPAAEYTLFSIPEEDGGTLIVNTQTGQNGRSYNEALDLGRIELQREVNSESVEAFTIMVTQTEDGGRLNLMWGTTIYYVDIEF